MIFSDLTDWVDAGSEDVSADETRVFQTRQCINSSIGTPPGCVGPSERVLSYRWRLDPKSWDDARDTCETEESGRLFDEMDGSLEQMQFLVDHMGTDSCFWIGVSTGTYGMVNMQGQDVESRRPEWTLLWADCEDPSNDLSIPNAVCVMGTMLGSTSSGKIIFSEEPQRNLPFVCFKIEY